MEEEEGRDGEEDDEEQGGAEAGLEGETSFLGFVVGSHNLRELSLSLPSNDRHSDHMTFEESIKGQRGKTKMVGLFVWHALEQVRVWSFAL